MTTETLTLSDAAQSAQVAYWRRLGLDADPLSKSSTSNFIVPAREQQLDLIQHLVHYGNLLLVVLGQTGSGKTVFSNQLREKLLDDSVATHIANATDAMDLRGLVKILRESFGLVVANELSIQQQLEKQLDELQYQGHHSVLMFDDAHQLPTDVLSTLLTLISAQSENQRHFHVVLFSDSNIRSRLEDLANEREASEFYHPMELEPFSREEAEAYFEHRFKAVGLQGPMPLSSPQLLRVWKQGEGQPGSMQVVAEELLTQTKKKPQRRSTHRYFRLARIVWGTQKKSIVGAGLILFLLILVSIWSERWLSQPATVPEQSSTILAEIKKQDGLIKPEDFSKKLSALKSDSEKPSANAISKDSSEKTTKALTEAEVKAKNLRSLESLLSKAKANKNVKTQPSTSETLQANKKSHAHKTLAVLPALPEPVKIRGYQAAGDIESGKKLSSSSATTASKNTSSEVLAQPSEASLSSAGLTEPTVTLPKNSAGVDSSFHDSLAETELSTALRPYNPDEKYLLTLPATHYTIQFIAAKEQKSLRYFHDRYLKYISHYQVYHYKTRLVAVYGNYSSLHAAERAVRHLPKPLRHLKPWIRPLHKVQAEIRLPASRQSML